MKEGRNEFFLGVWSSLCKGGNPRPDCRFQVSVFTDPSWGKKSFLRPISVHWGERGRSTASLVVTKPWRYCKIVMDAAVTAVLSVLDNIVSLKEEQRKERKRERRLFNTLYSFSFVKTSVWWLATKWWRASTCLTGSKKCDWSALNAQKNKRFMQTKTFQVLFFTGPPHFEPLPNGCVK